MRRRYILTPLLIFVVSSEIFYIAVEYLPILKQNAHAIEAFATTKFVMPTPTLATKATNVVTNAISGGTCDDLLVLVDKTYGLPESYAPPDRVHLADFSIPVTQSAIAGRRVMVNDLQRLFADSAKAGVDLKVVSAHRSYSSQAEIYASYVQQYGTERANRFSALPGHSQHQLGTAIDFSTDEISYNLSPSFARTKAGQWLLANAYKYGFYLSYPQGQESVTGYEFEPWHFRYLGVQNVSQLRLSGMIMQTYLQRHSILCYHSVE